MSWRRQLPIWNTPAIPPIPLNGGEWKKRISRQTPKPALAHQARSIDHADWPKWNPPHPTIYYLNDCRNLSNELADAALYYHLQGDDAAAIETLHDQWHLADLLQNESNKLFVRFLVSKGIQAEILNRLEVITSNVVLTKDPNNTKALQTSAARELIGQLLAHRDAKAEVNDVLHDESEMFHTDSNANPILKPSIDRIIETSNRLNAERGLVAMSLACHLYRFDTGQWPKSLNDLNSYLPSVPTDPFGDGKQTLGYALIKGALPDGSDRPLVYSRAGMKDGLFFRIDVPAYSFYVGDGSQLPAQKQKQGGQFRDVAGWAPPEESHPIPTTQPLE